VRCAPVQYPYDVGQGNTAGRVNERSDLCPALWRKEEASVKRSGSEASRSPASVTCRLAAYRSLKGGSSTSRL